MNCRLRSVALPATLCQGYIHYKKGFLLPLCTSTVVRRLVWFRGGFLSTDAYPHFIDGIKYK